MLASAWPTAWVDALALPEPMPRMAVSTVSKMLVLGLQRVSRADLEAIQAAGETLDIRVLGLASIDEDVPAALAQATIASVTVLGAFQASAAVKAALAGRIG